MAAVIVAAEDTVVAAGIDPPRRLRVEDDRLDIRILWSQLLPGLPAVRRHHHAAAGRRGEDRRGGRVGAQRVDRPRRLRREIAPGHAPVAATRDHVFF